MKSFTIATLLSGLAAASPAKSLQARGTFCGQWESEISGDYTVYNNLWGKDQATSGNQCVTNKGLGSNGMLSYSVNWNWAGGQGHVKSYPNAVVKAEKKALSQLSSVPTTWSWSYTGNNIVANVAYDLFTSSTPTGSNEYEFMIWLGALGGAGPISATGSPIATVNLAGHTWDLYNGKNGQMNVFSFVAKGGNVQNFSGDLVDFTKYLTANQGVSGNQILVGVGAGTEPFTGSDAVFATNQYSVVVKY